MGLIQLVAQQRRLAAAKLPEHLILFVTDRCNAKCVTCFYWENLNKGESLTMDQVERLAASMGPLTWLDISGGEPFLRADLATICHTFVRVNGASLINIPTNGLQVKRTREVLDQMLGIDAPIRVNIAVSIDAIGERHDEIRGVPGNWGRALETLDLLREIRARDPRLAVAVVTTLMRHNDADVKELLHKGVDEWALDYHSINLLRGVPPDGALAPPTAEQYREVSALQLRLSGRYYRARYGTVTGQVALVGRRLLNRYYMQDLEGAPRDIACSAGRVSAVVDANGDVFSCELLEKIGNLNDHDWQFPAVWHGEAAERQRERIAAGCHCTHECFHTKNLAVAPWIYL